MVAFNRVDIDTEYCASLVWLGDRLVDPFGSGSSYGLDGSQTREVIARGYAYKFDSIKAWKNFAVLYEALGTKGLLIDLERGSDIRELNRPYYHANDYQYPVALFSLPEGTDVVCHCPHGYDTLDIEELETGKRLTPREYNSADIFHSLLEASLDGRFLLDRGWVWHPFNVLSVYDIQRALEDPSHLDGNGLDVLVGGSPYSWEPETATFCGHRVVYSSILDYVPEPGEEEDGDIEILAAEQGVPEKMAVDEGKVRRVLGSDIVITDKDGKESDTGDTRKAPDDVRYLLQVHDLDKGELVSSREMPEFLGRMMPVGERHVVSFYDHPKLIEVETGKVVARWEDIYPGPEVQQPSVMMRLPKAPQIAMDPANKRFAVGSEKRITMVLLGDV